MLTLLGACTSATVPASIKGDASALLSVQMSVPAAYWKDVESKYKSDTPENFVLNLRSKRLDPKWAPLLSACFSVEGTPNWVCVEFSGNKANDRLEIGLLLITPNERKERRLLEGDVFVGKDIHLQAHATDGKLNLKINQGTTFSFPMQVVPRTVRLGCSSADCAFNMS